MLLKTLYIVLLILSLQTAGGNLIAQPQIEWYRTYNSPANGNDRAASMAIDSSGNIIVCGSDGEGGYRTIKYTSTGQQLWSVRYFEFPGFPLVAKKVVVDALNNIYVTGYNESIVTVKYNSLGILQWVRKYKGNGSFLCEPHDMEIDRSGFIYVTGQSSVQTTFFDYVTIKYNSTGDSLWTRTYNGIGNRIDGARALEVDSIGNVYITGKSESLHDTNYYSDITTIKYDNFGNTIWVNRYFDPNNRNGIAYDIALDNNEDILVTGFLEDSNFVSKLCTIKYNSIGQILWNRLNVRGVANKIKINNNHIFIGGDTNLDTTGADYSILKYDSDGTLNWIKIINGNIDDHIEDMILDDSSNCYFIGGFYYGKIDKNSNVLWFQPSNVNATVFTGKSLLQDNKLNLFVFGDFFPSGPSQTDFITIKYNQPIGISLISTEIPKVYKLFPNYPNPFNPVTTIKYDLPKDANVKIKIYDLLGREVANLINNDLKKAGSYQIEWNAGNFASGVYFYRIEAGSFVQSKKMVLVK